MTKDDNFCLFHSSIQLDVCVQNVSYISGIVVLIFDSEFDSLKWSFHFKMQWKTTVFCSEYLT